MLRTRASNMSQIQQFYAGQKIFITGGTGFLGKILIEKLLRSCPDIATVYLLIRAKKGQSARERIDSLLVDPVFEVLRSEYPIFANKIVAVNGDIAENGLGLSTTDYACLVEEVAVIFHLAATVRFDEKLEKAVAINVNSVKYIVDIAKACKNLKVGVYVSTAYSNCVRKTINEELYPPPLCYEKVNEIIADARKKELSDEEMQNFTNGVMGEWPNTYTFAKAIAEGVVAEFAKEIPFAIFRPSIDVCVTCMNHSSGEFWSAALNKFLIRVNRMIITNAHIAGLLCFEFIRRWMSVMNAYREPIPGWLAGPIGLPGIMCAGGLGIAHVVLIDEDIRADIVPVDYVCNALISCAWETATTERRHHEDIPVYNYVSGNENPVIAKELFKTVQFFGRIYPSNSAVYYPCGFLTKSVWLFTVSNFFFHMMPALIIDIIARLFGKQTGLYKLACKLRDIAIALAYFSTQSWDFENQRVQNLWNRIGPQDKLIFPFSMRNVDWHEHNMKMIRGLRKYIVGDTDENVEQARRRQTYLFIIHTIVCLAFGSFVIWIIWKLFFEDTAPISTQLFTD